jgi:hypothetical protein
MAPDDARRRNNPFRPARLGAELNANLGAYPT